MAVGLVVLIVIFIIFVNKPDFLINIIQPGSGVRNACLSEYSESVTIEEAFDNFFENGK